MNDENRPLACDMSALHATERERHRSVTDALVHRVTRSERLDGGYRLQLPADGETIELAAEFLSRERLCCPFLTFRLTVPSRSDAMALDLTGPAGTAALLSEALKID